MAGISRNKLQFLVWAGAIVGVLAVGLYYLPYEADHPNFWEALYSTLRLFVFERDLPTFPKAPQLIFIYFIAPLITLSVLGTIFSYLFAATPALRCRLMSDHVVVCGMGRSGKLLASTLKGAGVKVVGIDHDPSVEMADWAAENRVPLIRGDFHSAHALEKAGAVRARSVIFAGGDDVSNLEGSLAAYELLKVHAGPVRLIWTHISDDHLADTARKALRTEGRLAIRIFDTYHIAAVRAVARCFTAEVRKNINNIDLVGFGRFGSDMLEVLINQLRGEKRRRFTVIDKEDRQAAVTRLARALGAADQVEFIRGEVRDLEPEPASTAYFLCTDDDLGNLSLALLPALDSMESFAFVRMTHWPLPAVVDRLGLERNTHFVNVSELVAEGLAELPGLFKPACEADLKRTKPWTRDAR